MTVQETLIALCKAWWEGLARVGYGIGGILPPDDYEDK